MRLPRRMTHPPAARFGAQLPRTVSAGASCRCQLPILMLMLALLSMLARGGGPAATGERGTGPLRRRRSQVSMPKVANAVQIQSLCRSAQPAHPCAHPPRGLLRDGGRRLRPRPEGRCCAARWIIGSVVRLNEPEGLPER